MNLFRSKRPWFWNVTYLQQADAGGRLRQQHQVDTPRQRSAPRTAGAAASATSCCRQQALRRQVRRHQGAGARGVRADAGALTKSQTTARVVFGLAEVHRTMKACPGSVSVDSKIASVYTLYNCSGGCSS